MLGLTLKKICFPKILSQRSLLNLTQSFSITTKRKPTPQNEKPTNKSAKASSKKLAKPKKSQKKLPLEEIIEQEDAEVVETPVKPVRPTKGKRAQPVEVVEPEEKTEISEVENIKANVKGKRGKKPEKEQVKAKPTPVVKPKKLPEEISNYSPDQLKLSNIKLGNQYSSSPINYHLSCDKTAENPYDNYLHTRSSEYTRAFILTERETTCYNYGPLPVVLKSGNGIFVQDVDNNVYIDFLSGYSSLNFGHCNKEILNSVIPQMSSLHMTSRAFYNNLLGDASKLLANFFQLDKVLFMNSGVEAGESAVKFARRWGYRVKGIPDNQAEVIFFSGNFWGRTIAACASSDDKSRYHQFGPFNGLGFHLIPYNDSAALSEALTKNPNVCAVMLEPIQGENGVVIPHENYLREVRDLCNKHNVLMIVDEIQTGLGRAAANSSVCSSKNVTPDLILLGKSLSGGFYPVSAVVGKNSVMDLIRPGEHGSTFGGNPLALKFVQSTFNFILNNTIFKQVALKEGILASYLNFKSKFIREIRGRGLLFAIELFPDAPVTANSISLYLMERGLLCKPTKVNTLRLSPPLIIDEEELYQSTFIIKDVFAQLEKLHSNYSNERETQFNFTVVSPQAAKIVMNRKEREKAGNPPESKEEETHSQPLASPEEAGAITSEEMPGVNVNLSCDDVVEQPDYFKEKLQKL